MHHLCLPSARQTTGPSRSAQLGGVCEVHQSLEGGGCACLQGRPLWGLGCMGGNQEERVCWIGIVWGKQHRQWMGRKLGGKEQQQAHTVSTVLSALLRILISLLPIQIDPSLIWTIHLKVIILCFVANIVPSILGKIHTKHFVTFKTNFLDILQFLLWFFYQPSKNTTQQKRFVELFKIPSKLVFCCSVKLSLSVIIIRVSEFNSVQFDLRISLLIMPCSLQKSLAISHNWIRALCIKW